MAVGSSEKSSPLLTDRDWDSVGAQFYSSSPFNFVVLDELLDAKSASRLRESLVNHWGWRKRNWVSQHLHNNRPNIGMVHELARSLKSSCAAILDGKELVDYWALMYTTNQPGRVHADICGVTMTYWLTSERFNADPESGGLYLFDVKRPEGLMAHEWLTGDGPAKYVAEHTDGRKEYVAYKGNRAVLFDGFTYHQTAELHFINQGPESYRINLALAFDDPDAYDARVKPYHEQLESGQ